jgi:hypothetical protein
MLKIFGGVAQLGERTVRIRKVESSILFVSTKSKTLKLLWFQGFSFAFWSVQLCGKTQKAHKKAHNLRNKRRKALIHREKKGVFNGKYQRK